MKKSRTGVNYKKNEGTSFVSKVKFNIVMGKFLGFYKNQGSSKFSTVNNWSVKNLLGGNLRENSKIGYIITCIYASMCSMMCDVMGINIQRLIQIVNFSLNSDTLKAPPLLLLMTTVGSEWLRNIQ